VDLRTVAAGYSPTRLLELEHPSLPRNAVLCGKLIAVLWLATGQVMYQRADSVAFGGVVGFTGGLLWVPSMLLLQLVALMTILCSRFFRSGCTLLAGAILILAVLDQPLFSNNRVFCAAVLSMLALGASGVLARLQLALVYFCAASDKLLTVDWRSGWFLRTFTADLCRVGALGAGDWSHGGPLPITCALTAELSHRPILGAVLSALVMATEFAIAWGYAVRARPTALLAVLFHCALFVLTGGTFGIFFYAGIACSVLVLDLERQPAPFDRALPYFVIGSALAGPWVRPWHASVLAVLALALAAQRWHKERSQVSG
jgi:hypothetical protein